MSDIQVGFDKSNEEILVLYYELLLLNSCEKNIQDNLVENFIEPNKSGNIDQIKNDIDEKIFYNYKNQLFENMIKNIDNRNIEENNVVDNQREVDLKKDNNFFFDKVERTDQNISQNMNYSLLKGRANDNSVEIDSQFLINPDCLFDNDRNNTIDSINYFDPSKLNNSCKSPLVNFHEKFQKGKLIVN